MTGKPTLWDQLIAGAGEAITDIRQKLVEEPWYGQALDGPQSELRSPSQELEGKRPEAPSDDRQFPALER